MPLKTILLITSVLITHFVTGQSFYVKGSLRDLNDKTAITGATVTLSLASDTAFKHNTVSAAGGVFLVKNIPRGQYRLSVSSIGYDEVVKMLSIKDSSVDLGTLEVAKKANMLDEVLIKAQTPPVKQKNDTLEYNASSFKVNPDANAEDMIRKMPGVTIEQGAVKAGGEDVRKVTVDGRDFFGDDATAALKNLPAEVIDKIQVFDRMSDQARFTGIEDANTTKSINIVTKAGMRNGQFGRIYAGYGTDEKYAAGGNVSFFNGDRRISVIGQTNNVNQQNFATEDLLGVTSSSSRGGRSRGGGGRGGGRGGQGGGGNFNLGGGGGNFLVGQQGGISKTNAFGINYSDLWGKKTEVTGSYFFNNTKNSSDEKLSREFFISGDSSQLYDEQNLSSSKNSNHRVNLRIETKIDSSNTLLFTPSISFQDNNSFNQLTGSNSIKNSSTTSQSISSNSRNTGGFNFNNGILYRHAFAKRGRTISLNLNTGINNREGETYLNAFNTYFENVAKTDTLMQFTDQSTRGYNISTNIAYTEPVGKKGQLQLNYNPSWSGNQADQQTFMFDGAKYSELDSSLSNKYDNLYTTQNAGLTYRLGDRDNSFSAGVAYQYANLSGKRIFPFATDVDRNFSNILPNLMWRKKLTEKSSIRLMYRSGTNAPSIDQLQEVINNSNPLFLRTGNPELEQEYSHRLVARYTFTNSLKGQSFFANIFFQKTQDYTANATYIASEDSTLSNTVTLYKGSQLTKPVNLDGYWSLRSFLTFGQPLRFIKSNINLNAGYTYSNAPGLINNVMNESRTQNYSLGAVLSSNVSEYVDFNLSYTANFNNVKNSIQPELNNNYFTQSAGIQVNLLSKKGWFIQNDVSNQSYSGLTDGFNQSFWLWNASAGKKFLKDQRADLRLSVFDLLKQNRSISRTTTETYIEDVQTQVLQQYFMLTFSYRLRNFGGSASTQRR
jgi:hypothetical protein